MDEHQAPVESEHYSERDIHSAEVADEPTAEENRVRRYAVKQPGGIHYAEDGGRASNDGGEELKRAAPKAAEQGRTIEQQAREEESEKRSEEDYYFFSSADAGGKRKEATQENKRLSMPMRSL